MGKLGLAFILATLAFAGFLFLAVELDWPRPVRQFAVALFAMGIPLSAGAGALLGVARQRRSIGSEPDQAPTR